MARSDFVVDLAPPPEEWDAWVSETPGGHYRQTTGWAHVKAAAGWDSMPVLLRSAGAPIGGCQLLVKQLTLGRGVAYVPRGPLFATRDPQLYDAMLSALLQAARRRRIVYVKLQPPVDRDDLPALLRRRGMVASDIQTAPAASVRVDVGPDRDVDELFMAMRSTVRRRVRQAEKRGVVVRDGGAPDLPALQELLEATGRRQGFDPYPAEYHRRLWEAFAPRGAGAAAGRRARRRAAVDGLPGRVRRHGDLQDRRVGRRQRLTARAERSDASSRTPNAALGCAATSSLARRSPAGCG